MEVVISGASGLIGSAFSAAIRRAGDRPIALVRRQPTANLDEIRWDPDAGTIDANSLDGVDAVVHLAGAGIGDKRWTESRKKLVRDSRVEGTSLLASTLANLDRKPSVFVCGSAIGFYGSRGDEELTEESARGTGFLADLVADWEQSAMPAIAAGIRTPLARTGVVLTPSGGSLKKQLPLFKLGLGGRFGSGNQWLSWISLQDQVRAIEHLITSTTIDGPVNLTAPQPVTNTTFTKTLGKVLGRPTLLPIPLIGPRLLFGKQLVEEVLLASQRILPSVLSRNGFTFSDETLESSLQSMLRK